MMDNIKLNYNFFMVPCVFWRLVAKEIPKFLAGNGSQGTIYPRQVCAAKKCVFHGGSWQPRILISLAVVKFSWRCVDFAGVLVFLAAVPPRKQYLAASSQGNWISLALYSWRILLGGQDHFLGGLGIFLGSFWPPRQFDSGVV